MIENKTNWDYTGLFVNKGGLFGSSGTNVGTGGGLFSNTNQN